MFDLVNFLIDRIYFMSQNHIRSTEQAKDAITVKGDLRLCATRSEGGRAVGCEKIYGQQKVSAPLEGKGTYLTFKRYLIT